MFPVVFLLATGALAAKPVGDPRTWLTAEDYPASALEAGEEGTVQAAILVGASGKPEDCMIRISSGSADLDALTCSQLLKRAQFSPARDASGHSVPSKVVQQVRWAIPREKLISQGFRMTYSVSSDGHIDGCKIDEFGGHDPDLTCSTQMVEELSQSALTKPLSAYSQVSVLLAMQVDDDTKITILRPESGERKILTQARINVGPNGTITNCQPDHSTTYNGRSVDLCAGPVQVGQREFDRDPTGRERVLTVSFEVIGKER